MNGRYVLLVFVCAFSILALSRAASARERILLEAPPSDDRAPSRPRVCAPVDGVLPPTVSVEAGLEPYVQKMLARSEDFRRQCQALGAQPRVYVRVHTALYGMPPSLFARTDVQRTVAGPLVATVWLQPHGNWAEWIGHEFEHILEQIEGMRSRDFRHGDGVRWESSSNMFESSRAIAAGRTIRSQVRRPSADAHD